jgi:hypothetical protein
VLEDLLSGSELTWRFERCLDDQLEVRAGVHRTLHFKQKYELVEAFNRVKRLQEEDKLLVREQQSYLSFIYAACRDNLEVRIETWKEHLTELLEKSEGPPVNNKLEVTRKYSVAEFDKASEVDLIRGTIARLWEAYHEVGVQSRKGFLHFRRDAGGLERPWPRRLKDRIELWAEEDGQSTDPFVELDDGEEEKGLFELIITVFI